MLTKSRWWLTKSSGGAGGLSDRAVEDNGRGEGVVDMLLQGVWWFGPQKHRQTIFGFGPQNLVRVLTGIGATCGVIANHASMRSKVVRSSWPSDAPILRWTISLLGLSGLA